MALATAEKADRRTERSRRALMAAFIDLLLTEGYETVTVERVAERANVGRSTFYMHYRSKTDILKQSMTAPSMGLAVLVGGDVSAAALVPLLTHFHEQRRKNRVFFDWPVRTIWAQHLAELIEPRLASLVRARRARPILSLPLLARQIAESQIGLVIAWLSERSPCKPAMVAEALVVGTRAQVAAGLGVVDDGKLTIPNEKLKFVHV